MGMLKAVMQNASTISASMRVLLANELDALLQAAEDRLGGTSPAGIGPR